MRGSALRRPDRQLQSVVRCISALPQEYTSVWKHLSPFVVWSERSQKMSPQAVVNSSVVGLLWIWAVLSPFTLANEPLAVMATRYAEAPNVGGRQSAAHGVILSGVDRLATHKRDQMLVRFHLPPARWATSVMDPKKLFTAHRFPWLQICQPTVADGNLQPGRENLA